MIFFFFPYYDINTKTLLCVCVYTVFCVKRLVVSTLSGLDLHILKTVISPDFSQMFSISYATFLILCEHVKCQTCVSLSSGVQGAGPQSFTMASTLSDLHRRQLVDLTFRSDPGLTFWWGIQAVLMSSQQCFSADLASPCHPSLCAVFIQDIPSSSTDLSNAKPLESHG